MKLSLAKVLARKKYQEVLYLTLCLLAASANNLCKQLGPRPGPTNCRAWSGSKLFDTLIVLKKKSNIKRVKYGTIIKCEGIIKAILENPKADQNTLFRKYVNFEPPRVYF